MFFNEGIWRKEKMLKSVKEYIFYFIQNKAEEKRMKKILTAMEVVDRSFFVVNKSEAYRDSALYLESGQTISQPSTVARTLLLAQLEAGMDVLELGAGSGWNACLIAFLVYPGKIVSYEVIKSLRDRAENNWQALKKHLRSVQPDKAKKLEKVEFKLGNIFDLIKEGKNFGSYDRIIITAGLRRGREEKIKELARRGLHPGGILVCPYQSGPFMVLVKSNDGEDLNISYTDEHYIFVPLIIDK
jgi:protein-L-isoaspartate(D-aspartate) O-methyltransferase